MKIIHTSDIHLGYNSSSTQSYENFLNEINKQSPSVVTIGGDFGMFNKIRSDDSLQLSIKMMSKLNGTKLAVPGNHDVAVGKEEEINSYDKIKSFNNECKESGIHSLLIEPYYQEGIGFVGCLGPFSHDAPPRDVFTRTYIRFPDGVENFEKNEVKKLVEHINILKKNKLNYIVALFHFPPLHGDFISNYWNALIDNINSIPLTVLYGHTHEDTSETKDSIKLIATGAGFGDAKYKVMNL